MKKSLSFILLLCSFALKAQIITTLSGTYGGSVYDPQQLAFDKYGNLYVPTGLGNKVLKIDTAGVITTFAGNGTAGYAGDSSLATSAEFDGPLGVATDTFGNVYIADAGNHRIRKIDAVTGIITTFAGNGTAGYGGDNGLAINATLFSPKAICYDKHGDYYIVDNSEFRVRKINASGIITTFAGNGTSGNTGDGAAATMAECTPYASICEDAIGDIYFVDGANYTIRKVDTAGIISTFAGDTIGSWAYNGDNIPALGAGIGAVSITFDELGEMIISDNGNYRIRKVDNSGFIHTIAGNGVYGYSGDNGPADSAEIAQPSGIAIDHCGNLFIAQVDDPCIRKVSFNPSCLPLSVPEISTNQITIYPNPTTDILNVDGAKAGTNYGLFNVTGIIVQTGILKQGNNNINIQYLPPGIYILEMMDEEGNKTIKKIVKE